MPPFHYPHEMPSMTFALIRILISTLIRYMCIPNYVCISNYVKYHVWWVIWGGIDMTHRCPWEMLKKPWIIQRMGASNERRRYIVTSSLMRRGYIVTSYLIGWPHALKYHWETQAFLIVFLAVVCEVSHIVAVHPWAKVLGLYFCTCQIFK